jgi:SAM-dependent methyltransferase
MPSEFDGYVESYRDIINRRAAITGETFEYFIDLRLGLVDEDLRATGKGSPRAILDFGCGIGATAQAMRRRFPDATIDGVDASERSIEEAAALGVERASFRHVERAPFPFPDDSFDLVYSNGTFHHVDRTLHASIVREFVRVLRPGGLVFVFENNPLNPLTVHGMRTNPFDAGTRMLAPWYLQRLVRGAGFATQAPQYYVFYPKALKRLRWTERYLRRVPIGAQYFVRGRA